VLDDGCPIFVHEPNDKLVSFQTPNHTFPSLPLMATSTVVLVAATAEGAALSVTVPDGTKGPDHAQLEPFHRHI
jgi:hypothetical protein